MHTDCMFEWAECWNKLDTNQITACESLIEVATLDMFWHWRSRYFVQPIYQGHLSWPCIWKLLALVVDIVLQCSISYPQLVIAMHSGCFNNRQGITRSKCNFETCVTCGLNDSKIAPMIQVLTPRSSRSYSLRCLQWYLKGSWPDQIACPFLGLSSHYLWARSWHIWTIGLGAEML